MNLHDLRQEYKRGSLDEEHAESDPLKQFGRWWDEALAAEVPEANAMTLATADPAGKPSARTVLLKGYDARGFVFFTNYESRKGQELDSNPLAALLFFWRELERQVRIEGRVELVSDAEADAYWVTRPRESQLGGAASDQSEPVANRAAMLRRWRALSRRYRDTAVPRPPHWTGYRVVPTAIEFWTLRPYRMHDRELFTRSPRGWRETRLQP